MASQIEQCEICNGDFDFAVTDIVGSAADRGFCQEHFREFARTLSSAHEFKDFENPTRFWLRAVVFGPNRNCDCYLEFSAGRFFNMGGGLCENALLRHVSFGNTPTIHGKFPELLSLFSATLIDIVIDRFDSSPGGARLRLDTNHGQAEFATRPTDAVAIAIVANKPMFISPSLNTQIEWGIKWGRIKDRMSDPDE
jgi:hypothetical protein